MGAGPIISKLLAKWPAKFLGEIGRKTDPDFGVGHDRRRNRVAHVNVPQIIRVVTQNRLASSRHRMREMTRLLPNSAVRIIGLIIAAGRCALVFRSRVASSSAQADAAS